MSEAEKWWNEKGSELWALEVEKDIRGAILMVYEEGRALPRLPNIDELTERYPDHEFMKADGFDDCVCGVIESFGNPPVLAYDKDKIIDRLTEDMSREEAYEFFEFNILGAYVGESTPVYLIR